MKRPGNENGFTLIEVIVTLTLAAVMAAMLVTITGASMQRAGEPAARLGAVYNLQQVMENINGYYIDLVHRGDALTSLESEVQSVDSDPATGFGAYKATKEWITYTGDPPVETTGTTDDILKITLEPVSGSAAIKLTEFFVM